MDASIEYNGIQVKINTPDSDKCNEIAKHVFSYVLDHESYQTPTTNHGIYESHKPSGIKSNINLDNQDSYEKAIQARLIQMKDVGVLKLSLMQIKEFSYKSAYWLYFYNSGINAHMSKFMNKYSCDTDDCGRYLYESMMRVAIETNYLTQP